MRRAIVHIGTPRTGTTSLQAVLSTHRAALEEAGVLYPDLTPRSVSNSHLSHQYLGEAFGGRRPRRHGRELLAALDEMLVVAKVDTVILSYEGLCLLPMWSRAPKILANLFARRGFSMEIMLTVKAQALYAQSQYTWRCQFLRESQFLAGALARDLRHRRYHYNGLLRGWARPHTRVHVVPVHDRRSNAPLIDRIFEQLGLTDRVGAIMTPADLTRLENRSLGPAAVEVSRRLCNRGVISADFTQARAITNFIAEQARAHGLDGTTFQGLDHTLVGKVEAKFAADNERFSQNFLGESWSQRIATVPLTGINEFGTKPIDGTVARQLEEIATETCQRFGLAFGVRFNSVLQGFVGGLGLRYRDW